MAQKLKKAWLYVKEHWYGFASLAIILIVSCILILGGNSVSNTMWFNQIKLLLKKTNERFLEILKAREDAEKREEEIKRSLTETKNKIEETAAKEQQANVSSRDTNAREVLEATKDDPDKAAEELGKAFGIPVERERK